MIDREDRHVHARCRGVEVVRYDRSGKWYVEIAADFGRRGLPAERKHVGIEEAVETARSFGAAGTIHLGLPGGGSFDRKIQL